MARRGVAVRPETLTFDPATRRGPPLAAFEARGRQARSRREDYLRCGRTDAQLSGRRDGLSSRAGAELAQDRGDVVRRGLLGDHEAPGEAGVAEALRQ